MTTWFYTAQSSSTQQTSVSAELPVGRAVEQCKRLCMSNSQLYTHIHRYVSSAMHETKGQQKAVNFRKAGFRAVRPSSQSQPCTPYDELIRSRPKDSRLQDTAPSEQVLQKLSANASLTHRCVPELSARAIWLDAKHGLSVSQPRTACHPCLFSSSSVRGHSHVSGSSSPSSASQSPS